MRRDRDRPERPPLNAEALEQAALRYAGHYATTRTKLRAYLVRKVRERGWEGPAAPGYDGLVERMAQLGYVDDRAFAASRAASLGRRGYGERRVGEALRAAGIGEDDGAEALQTARDEAWTAALRFAQRRKLGPFAPAETDRAGRDKALAAMLRAGHPMDLARKLVAARPGEIPDADGL